MYAWYSLILKVYDSAEMSNIEPIRPIHTFTIDQLADAMRFMKKGDHIGKIVITMPESPASALAPTKDAQAKTKTRNGGESSRLRFSAASTYLMVGGMGGLGRIVTRWMVDKGARHFCFLSRSAGKSGEDRALLEELRSQGCCAVAVAGSVAEMADVKRAIASAPSSIAGVLQMSMVIRVRSCFHLLRLLPFLSLSILR